MLALIAKLSEDRSLVHQAIFISQSDNLQHILNYVHFGETGRSIRIRLCEYQTYLTTGFLLKCTVAEHQLETGHQIIFDSASVEAKPSSFLQGKIREAIDISTYVFNINREAGYSLRLVWYTVLNSSFLACSPMSS